MSNILDVRGRKVRVMLPSAAVAAPAALAGLRPAHHDTKHFVSQSKRAYETLSLVYRITPRWHATCWYGKGCAVRRESWGGEGAARIVQ